MFEAETTTFLANVAAKTLQNAVLPVDVSACVAACPRLAQTYQPSKPDYAAIAKTTLLAHLLKGDSLFDLPKLKLKKDETCLFKESAAIIAIGVNALLEEFDAIVAEMYALQTEALFKQLSRRRSKKSDRVNVAKYNVNAFRTMFPSGTEADLDTFLETGAFWKPKAPRKRATKAAEAAEASATEASATEASEASATEASADEGAKKVRKGKAKDKKDKE